MYRALKDKVLLSLYKNYKCNFVKCIPPKAKGDLNLISKTHCMIANNETEFLQHVLTLMKNHDLRKKLAKNARSYIESHHSLVNLSKGIFDAYEI